MASVKDNIEIKQEFYSNGKLKNRSSYLGANLYGPSERWYENGQQEFKYNWLDNKQHGLQEAWYHNGDPRIKINIFNGNPHGLQQEWASDGKLTQKYYLNGKEVTEDEFKKYLFELGESISQQLNLDEKSLGMIIAGYSE